jgi:hypothetical protein
MLGGRTSVPVQLLYVTTHSVNSTFLRHNKHTGLYNTKLQYTALHYQNINLNSCNIEIKKSKSPKNENKKSNSNQNPNAFLMKWKRFFIFNFWPFLLSQKATPTTPMAACRPAGNLLDTHLTADWRPNWRLFTTQQPCSTSIPQPSSLGKPSSIHKLNCGNWSAIPTTPNFTPLRSQ